MWLYYFSIILAVLSNACYYFIQKSTPHDTNPVLSLVITYFVAMAACLCILPFYPDSNNLVQSFRKLNWTSFALGFAIIGLEMGFLLAFRSGWNISFVGVFVNAIAALILIPVGILLFKEHLTLQNILGIILCLSGLFLISRK